MLNYKILQNKNNGKKIVDGQSVTFTDLLCKDMYEGVYINNFEFVVVNKDYVARPDLISLAIYKTDEYADIICKINGISNPFELNEDMLLICPSISEIDRILKPGTQTDIMTEGTNVVQSIGTSTYQKSNLDKAKETISKEAKNKLQKQKSERRSPAEQTVTDNNFVIDKSLGIVIY